MPPDPSQQIPPEARGRVRRRKKFPAGGVGPAGGGVSAAPPSAHGGGEGGEDKDRTFVTSRCLVEESHSNVDAGAT